MESKCFPEMSIEWYDFRALQFLDKTSNSLSQFQLIDLPAGLSRLIWINHPIKMGQAPRYLDYRSGKPQLFLSV